MGQNFTLTAGVRYSLYSPPWEVNGLQVVADHQPGRLVRDAARADGRRAARARTRRSIQFDLAGPKNNKPGFYDWDKNNFAPRLAAAWTPHGGFRISGHAHRRRQAGHPRRLFDGLRPHRQRARDQLRSAGSFGLSTVLSSPFGENNEDEPSIRFQGVDVVPPTLPVGAARRIPADAAVVRGRHHRGARRHHHDAVLPLVQRDRRPRARPRLLDRGRIRRPPRPQPAGPPRRRDAGRPHRPEVRHGLLHRGQAADPVCAERPASTAAPIRPPTAGSRRSRTGRTCSRMRRATASRPRSGWRTTFNSVAPDWMTALYGIDEFCDPACSSLGAFAFFTPQYDTLGDAEHDRPLVRTTRCRSRCASAGRITTSST